MEKFLKILFVLFLTLVIVMCTVFYINSKSNVNVDNNAVAELTQELEQEKQKNDLILNENAELKEQKNELQENLNNIQLQYDNSQLELKNVNTSLAEKENLLAQKQTELENAIANGELKDEELVNKQREIENLQAEIENLELEIETLNSRIDNLIDIYNSNKEQIKFLNDYVNSLELAINAGYYATCEDCYCLEILDGDTSYSFYTIEPEYSSIYDGATIKSIFSKNINFEIYDTSIFKIYNGPNSDVYGEIAFESFPEPSYIGSKSSTCSVNVYNSSGEILTSSYYFKQVIQDSSLYSVYITSMEFSFDTNGDVGYLSIKVNISPV